jgi:alpha-galactosidase
MRKSIRIYNLCFISFLILGMILSSCDSNHVATGTGAEIKVKSKWVKEHLLDSDPQLPFSFLYDGKASSELLKTWEKKTATNKLDTNRTQYINTWTDNKTGLEVRCVAVEYSDYSAVEWTVYFRNTSTNNTPILKNIQGLNARFEKNAGGEFVLNGNKGDWCVAESYEPYSQTLEPKTEKHFAPTGGRPTNGPEGWPYYNLQMPGGGVIIAVGWPGQWASSFVRDDKNELRIVAGQELTNLYLKPGEEIRSPLIVMLFWQGTDVVAAQNLWRRWYMAHNIPRLDGKIPEPIVQIQLQRAGQNGNNCFNDGANVMQEEANKFALAGIEIDLYWRDAGWYPCGGKWYNTGTWEVDRTRFPNGFKPIADWVHARGKKLTIWFEPERVGDENSWLAKNHPEWLLGQNRMNLEKDPEKRHWMLGLNLGNTEARHWVLECVDGIMKDNGIDVYRQDFNYDPLANWRGNDSPDRQGMTENLYVQGFLAFWDELRQRHPGMLIDACASGGRRNDLETMRRAVPQVRSDFQFTQKGVAESNQGQTYGLSAWLPYQGSGVYSSDTYSYRSFYLPSFGMVVQMTQENIKAIQQAYAECRKIAPMMLGDYYPLTPYSLAVNKWIAWQFNRPEQGDGVIQVFRRGDCADATQTYRLHGLDQAGTYEVKNFDVVEETRVSGKDLMEKGLTIEIKDKAGAAVITYKELK